MANATNSDTHAPNRRHTNARSGRNLHPRPSRHPPVLLLPAFAHAAGGIYRAIVASEEGEKALKPILRPYDQPRSIRYVELNTIGPIRVTDPFKCSVSHVVGDTGN